MAIPGPFTPDHPATERTPLRALPSRTPPEHAARAHALSRPDLSNATTALALVALTAVAGFLRIWNSAGQSLRLDEGFTLRWASSPLQPVMQGNVVLRLSIWQYVASDVHPPGYFLLIHFWMQAFGTGLATLRFPSEVAGTLAIPALFLLGSRLYNRSVGLMASVLGAFSPFWIWHAQEARMYPFLLLFTILSTYGIVEALRHRHMWGWALYGVASLLAIYTQYFAFLVLFSQGLFVLWHWRQYPGRNIVSWIVVNVLVAAAFVPWLLTFHTYYRGASDPSLAPLNLYTPLILLSNFFFGYLSVPTTSNVVAAWPLLVALSLALGVFAGRINRPASLLWLLLLVPIAVVFFISIALHPFLSVRYLVVCVPALYILVAVALDRLPRGRSRLLVAAVLAGISLLAWHVEEVSPANPEAENYRGVVAYIQSHARPGDIIALDSPYNQDAFSYYSHFNMPVYELPFPLGGLQKHPRVDPAALPAYLHTIEAGRRHLWVVYYLEQNYDPTGVVRHYLSYHTRGNAVIFGGPFKRDESAYPASFTSVQLVKYDLVRQPAQVAQVRPLTMQQLRAVTRLSPTLRRPFDPPFGPYGATAPAIGTLLAPPPPIDHWVLPALPSVPHRVTLTLANFNVQPATATVQAQGAGQRIMRQIQLPGHASIDVQLASWPTGPNAALSINANASIVTERSVRTAHSEQFTYGLRRVQLGTSSSPA